MADGSCMPVTASSGPIWLDLDEAIARLEAGGEAAGVAVDLGGGAIARADGARGAAGLLQRLKAYRLLKALAEAETMPEAMPDGHASPAVLAPARSLLDAVRKAR